jgi:hypothetical protein
MPHLGVTLLLAVLLSATIAATGQNTLRERIFRAAYVFICATGAVAAGSWVMFFIES